jgi:hypothetical protein
MAIIGKTEGIADASETPTHIKQNNFAVAASFLYNIASSPIRAVTDAVQQTICNPFQGYQVPAQVSEPDRQIMRLKMMRGAGDGWAGPGSVAPNEESLAGAIAVIEQLKHSSVPCPMASIGTHGNAGLYWSDSEIYADVEILSDGNVGYLIQLNGQPALDDEEEMPASGLPPTIGRALAMAYLRNHR